MTSLARSKSTRTRRGNRATGASAIPCGMVAIAVALSACGLQPASAQVTFEFIDDGAGAMSPFDGVGIGFNETLNDGGTAITLTSLDIIGQDGSLASDGINLHETNVQASVDALGINDFSNPGGYSNDSRDFNPGEGWIFSFDVDIEFLNIDFASQGNGADMSLLSSAFPTIVMPDGQSGDVHEFTNLFVPANTPITLQMTGLPDAADTSVRLTRFEIAAGLPPVDIFSVTSGDLNTGSTWDTGTPPEAGFNYVVSTGDVVTANSTSFAGDGVTVQTGATLDLATSGVVIDLIDVQEGASLTSTTAGDFAIGNIGLATLTSLNLNGQADITASPGAEFFLDVELSGAGDLNFESNGPGSNMWLSAAGGHQGTIRFNGSGDQVRITEGEGFNILEMNSTGSNTIFYDPLEIVDIQQIVFNQPGEIQHAASLSNRRLFGAGDLVANAAITADLTALPVGNERRLFLSSLSGSGDITVNGTATDPTDPGVISHNEFELGSSSEPAEIAVDTYSGTITTNDFVDVEIRRSIPNAKIVVNNNGRLEMGFGALSPGTKVAIGEVEINSGGDLEVGFEQDDERNVYTLRVTSQGDRSGDLTLAAGSTTRMQVNGVAEDQYDSIEVQGDATLDGALEIFVNPDGSGVTNAIYSPTLGDTFDLIEIVGEPLVGDYDGDGNVDAGDYLVWSDSFGSMEDLAADGNGDGVVDAADYTIWRDNEGATAPLTGTITGSLALSVIDPGAVLSGAGLAFQLNVTPTLLQLEVVSASSLAVPEPMGIALASMAFGATAVRRNRNR